MATNTTHCPQCGTPLTRTVPHAKLQVCSHCHNLVLLENHQANLVGKKSILPATPSILHMHREFNYRGWRFVPIGQVRYALDQDEWEAWWVVDRNGENGKWIHVDEGEITTENPIDPPIPTPEFHLSHLFVGTTAKLYNTRFILTRKDAYRCIGLAGALPKYIEPDESYTYLEFTSPEQSVITVEITPEQPPLFLRYAWLDPFDIKPV